MREEEGSNEAGESREVVEGKRNSSKILLVVAEEGEDLDCSSYEEEARRGTDRVKVQKERTSIREKEVVQLGEREEGEEVLGFDLEDYRIHAECWEEASRIDSVAVVVVADSGIDFGNAAERVDLDLDSDSDLAFRRNRIEILLLLLLLLRFQE